MTKNYKAVLKSSLVMLVLFAVAGSGVAQAQECIARADDMPTTRSFAPRALPRWWGTSNCCAGTSPPGSLALKTTSPMTDTHCRTEHPGHQS